MDRPIRLVDRFLAGRSTSAILLIALSLLVFVGFVDGLTGVELSFSVFYLLPVSVASWYGGRRPGFLISAFSASTWFLTDFLGGHVYSHPGFAYWNASVRLVFFLVTAHLLALVHELLREQTLLARRDPLTGVLNSRAFHEQALVVFRLADRYLHHVAIGYLDLDGFKALNDTLGHVAGDGVLLGVAEVIREQLRESDLVGRMGGDEFAILLPDADADRAREAFERIHGALAAVAGARRWPVGFSIGVSVFQPPLPAIHDALRAADDLMYQVKTGTKNAVLVREGPAIDRTVG